jgi:hypothetical protein
MQLGSVSLTLCFNSIATKCVRSRLMMVTCYSKVTESPNNVQCCQQWATDIGPRLDVQLQPVWMRTVGPV